MRCFPRVLQSSQFPGPSSQVLRASCPTNGMCLCFGNVLLPGMLRGLTGRVRHFWIPWPRNHHVYQSRNHSSRGSPSSRGHRALLPRGQGLCGQAGLQRVATEAGGLPVSPSQEAAGSGRKSLSLTLNYIRSPWSDRLR